MFSISPTALGASTSLTNASALILAQAIFSGNLGVVKDLQVYFLATASTAVPQYDIRESTQQLSPRWERELVINLIKQQYEFLMEIACTFIF